MNFTKVILLISLIPSGAYAGPSTEACTISGAIRDVKSDGTGAELVQKLTSRQAKILQTLTYSKDARKVFAAANDALKALDFDQLLDSRHAVQTKDGAYVFPFHGGMQDDIYKVQFQRKLIYESQVEKFLESAFQFAIKENPSFKTDAERGYGVTAEGVVVVDEFDHRFTSRLTKNQLEVLDINNLRLLKSQESQVFSGVSGLARAYINDAAQTLPETLDFFDYLFDAEMKLKPISKGEAEVTDVLLRLKLDMNKLNKKYPNLAVYVEEMMQDLSFVSSSVLTTADNLILARSRMSLAENILELRFVTAKGLIVPTTRDGDFILSKGIDMSNIKTFNGKITTSFSAKVYGLSIANDGIESSVEYREGRSAVLRSKLLKVPVARFGGGLFGFMPPDFLDIMMPGSLEGYAKIFSDGLVKGNAGKGSYAEAKFQSDRPGKSKMLWRITAELKDDFFLNIGLRVLNDYLWPNDDAIKDIRRLSAQMADGLNNDVQKLLGQPNRENRSLVSK